MTIHVANAPSGGSTTLADDTDVAVTSPANNQGLVYNAIAGKWENASLTAALVGALPATDDLSAIATANPTAAAVAMNSKKITGLANGAASTDAAAFGQIPTVVPALEAVAPVTTAGALVAGKHNPVDASAGALTMTLPTGQPIGTMLSVSNYGATNAVTVTGSLRGASSSFGLSNQYDAYALVTDAAGSWWPFAALLSSASIKSMTLGLPLALTGATGATRYVGGTSSGAPTSGTFAQGDFIVARTTGNMWVCTTAGTPGTWVQPGASAVGGVAVSGTPAAGQVLTATSASAANWQASAGGGGGGALTEVGPITTSTTLGLNTLNRVDASGGSTTQTLPTAPADKTIVSVKLIAVTSPNAVTLTCGGSDVFNLTGGLVTRTLDQPGQGFSAQYDAADHIWVVTVDYVPKTALDALYTPLQINDSGNTYAATGQVASDIAALDAQVAANAAAGPGSYGVSKWVSGTGWPSTRPNYALVRFSGPGSTPTAWSASTTYQPWQVVWNSNNLYAWTNGNPASPTSGTSGTTFNSASWQQIPVAAGDTLGFYS